MKRSTLCLLVLLVSAGCAEITAPPPTQTTGGGLSAYFWPNATMSYHYTDSIGRTHSVVTSRQSGSEFVLLDSNDSDGLPHVLTASLEGSGASLAGLSDRTLLALPAGAIVTDGTQPHAGVQPHIEAIADLHSQPGAHSVFAATDQGLFTYSTKSDSLVDAHIPLPSPTISSLYAGDNGFWYAISDSDGRAFYSINSGITWLPFELPAGRITASAIGDALFIAIDRVGIFRCEPNGITKLISISSDHIDALATLQQRNELLLGTESGKIEHFNGSSVDFAQTLVDSGKILPIQKLFISDDGSVYAATATNVYLSTIPGWLRLLSDSQPTDFWQDNGSVYYSTLSGSIYRSHDNQSNFVSIVASPLRAVVPSSGRKIALVGDSLFVSSGNYDKWNLAKDASADPVWFAGTFQMLPRDSSLDWLAGEVLTSDRHQQTLLDYTGRLLDRTDQIVLSGKSYSNVAIVRYAIENGLTVDTKQGPEYVVFYERDKGIIRIETTTNGQLSTVWQIQ